jgi:hypothetical protein
MPLKGLRRNDDAIKNKSWYQKKLKQKMSKLKLMPK